MQFQAEIYVLHASLYPKPVNPHHYYSCKQLTGDILIVTHKYFLPPITPNFVYTRQPIKLLQPGKWGGLTSECQRHLLSIGKFMISMLRYICFSSVHVGTKLTLVCPPWQVCEASTPIIKDTEVNAVRVG